MSLWGRVWNHTLGALQGFTALVFLVLGVGLLDQGSGFWDMFFAKIGMGQWFRYLISGLEVVCAILLVIPRTSAIAVLLLACTMVGMILADLFVVREPPIENVLPVSLLLMLYFCFWRRRASQLPRRGN